MFVLKLSVVQKYMNNGTVSVCVNNYYETIKYKG